MSTVRIRVRFDAAYRAGQVLWWIDGQFAPRRPEGSSLAPAGYVVARVEAGQAGHVDLFAWAQRHPEILAGHGLDDFADLVDDVRGVAVAAPAAEGNAASLAVDRAILESLVAGWKSGEP